MTQLHWMALKLYLPTLGCLLLAFASTWLLTSLAPATLAHPLGDVLRWIPYGLLGLAAVLGIVASAHLLRWETGDALICGCGGLLGGERQGRFGAYRTCAACGRTHVLAK
ncbi:hypothetical protein J2X02_000320 [Pseudoxanthomonas japonensis]|uniref:hypothetical protein n=1 Tax=Pseudoxanthomonas japonensis TaxID=69284 RepID=UPI002866D877|nr:hypothetical protein [Pseudoxanthomonas japonensis]MDR7067503.1 hypothetical protein [Pseudoxanthomonas japonensis]